MSYYFNELRTNAFNSLPDLTKKWAYSLTGATSGTTTTLAFRQTAARTLNLPDGSGGLVATSVNNGSRTIGDLLYASSVELFGSLPAVATGSVLLSQGVATAPAWGQIDLSTSVVTGVLPIARGGTNSGTALVNGRVMISSGGAIVENTAGTANQLLHGDLSWAAVDLTADVTGVLPIANGGTGVTSFTANSIVVTDGVGALTTTPQPLGPTLGGTGQSTYATGDLIYASAPNTLAKRTIGTAGQVLGVVGGVPTWQNVSAINTISFCILGTTYTSYGATPSQFAWFPYMGTVYQPAGYSSINVTIAFRPVTSSAVTVDVYNESTSTQLGTWTATGTTAATYYTERFVVTYSNASDQVFSVRANTVGNTDIVDILSVTFELV